MIAEHQPMGIAQIMRLLPHRHPMLLLDRVSECIPGQRIAAYKNITKAESSLSHGGEAQGMPRVLLLEALAQIAVILTFKTLRLEPTGSELMFFAGIDDARFAGSVLPGDRLDLYVTVTRMMPRRGIGKFAAEARVDGALVVQATLIAALRVDA